MPDKPTAATTVQHIVSTRNGSGAAWNRRCAAEAARSAAWELGLVADADADHADRRRRRSGPGARDRLQRELPAWPADRTHGRLASMAEQNAADLISLPQGGGALAGIGETFQPDPHTGTGNFSVPLPLPAGPRRVAAVSCRSAYSTGNPNGPFGLGWALVASPDPPQDEPGHPALRDTATPRRVRALRCRGPRSRSPPATDRCRYRPAHRNRLRAHHPRQRRDRSVTTGRCGRKDGLRSRYGTPTPAGADRPAGAIRRRSSVPPGSSPG